MEPKEMAYGCPNRVVVRDKYACKALLGQPNKAECDPENCAAVYIADLMISELRADVENMNAQIRKLLKDIKLNKEANLRVATGG